MIEVMVVEDDSMVMELTCDYVGSVDGFTVVARANGGAAALDEIAKRKIDLIILDIYMPVMNGVEFLTRLRSQGNAADVIFLTAANNNKMIDNALKLGAVDYLIKPFKYERFKDSLEKYARRHKTIKKDGETTTEELDSLLGRQPGGEKGTKGLHPKTLERVREYLKNNESDTIAQTEMTRDLGLSSVTVRRYMEYLTLENEVVLEVEYGSVGRPRYTYRKLKS